MSQPHDPAAPGPPGPDRGPAAWSPPPPAWGQPPPGWYPPPPKPPKGWALGLPPSGPGSLAPPLRRLGARLLDGLFLLPVFLLLLAIALLVFAPHFGPLFPEDPFCPPSVPQSRCPTSDDFPGVIWLYLTLFAVGMLTALFHVVADAAITARWGRTPGKAILRIRPLRAVDRSPLTFWRAFGRAAATTAASQLSWVGLLDPLWCLWDANAQCIHDKLADTIVVSDE